MKGKSSLFSNQGNKTSFKAPKVFNSSNFRYSDSKVKYQTYLLNPNHKDGGSKAKFLKELGYSQGDSKKLHNAITKGISGREPYSTENTKYGIKCKYKTLIIGNDGKYHNANVTIVIQNDDGKSTWRIITLTPGKRGQTL